ncbi:hypothetical protein BG004_004567 [Podila humilis]|nr:hypothetical protein BG004_004567 [Podila humilis]
MAPTTTTPAEQHSAATTLDPQDIGAIFAHEYYTFLNKDPARLHCFYNPNSTLSHGFQGEETDVCVGQLAIKSKITNLNFVDCKVLITNIDCQQSLDGSIIIQVLGDLANDGGLAQKFVQTFFLAQQPKGYYVLNDIFRYLKDEPEEEEEDYDMVSKDEGVGAVTTPEQEETQCQNDPHHVQIQIDEVEDHAAESVVEPEATVHVAAAQPAVATEEVNDTKAVESSPASVPATVTTTTAPAVVGDHQSADTVASDEKKLADKKKTDRKPDRKKDIKKDAKKEQDESTTTTVTPEESHDVAPVTTHAPATAVATTPVVESTKPEAPKTWANLAAKNTSQWGSNVTPVKASSVTPVHPTPAPAAVTTPTQSTSAGVGAATTGPSAGAAKGPMQKPYSGHHHHGGDRPRIEYHSIYIKNVSDRMTLDQIREAFSKFGVVKHLEYARVRNCAFLDFTTADAVVAALKQVHVPVGNEQVLAGERHRNKGNGFQNGNNNNNRSFYANNNGSGSGSNNNSNNNNNGHAHHQQNGTMNGHGAPMPRSEPKPFTNGRQPAQSNGGRGGGPRGGRNGSFHSRPENPAPAVAVK